MLKSLALLTGLMLLAWGNATWASSATAEITSNCVNCHDAEMPNNAQHGPNLAGQNSTYLIEQINLFRSRTRLHPILSTNSYTLSNDELINLTDYYANFQSENLILQLNEAAEIIYSACSACHGPNGEGVAPFPKLIGQTPEYLEQQLINYKTGVRKNAIMQAMTINLSDEEIKLLATYLGLPKQTTGISFNKIMSVDFN